MAAPSQNSDPRAPGSGSSTPCSAVSQVKANAHLYVTKKQWREALAEARAIDCADANAPWRGLKPLKPFFISPNARALAQPGAQDSPNTTNDL